MLYSLQPRMRSVGRCTATAGLGAVTCEGDLQPSRKIEPLGSKSESAL